MDFQFRPPTCPVCQADTVEFRHQKFYDDFKHWKATEQNIAFQCGASYKNRNDSSYTHRETRSVTETWKVLTPCSKAQEIALKLLAEKEAPMPTTVTGPNNKYEGKPAHAAAGWKPN